MTRKEEEQYVQDRQGNSERELGEYVSRDGDVLDVASGDTGNDLILYDFPDDAQEVHLTQIRYVDISGSAASFELKTATLDSNGNVDTATKQTIDFQVSASSDRVIEWEGEPFTDDAIVVNTDSESEVAVGVRVVHKEYHESASEQTTA